MRERFYEGERVIKDRENNSSSQLKKDDDHYESDVLFARQLHEDEKKSHKRENVEAIRCPKYRCEKKNSFWFDGDIDYSSPVQMTNNQYDDDSVIARFLQQEEEKKNKRYARQDASVARKINDQYEKDAYLAKMLQDEENANNQMYRTTNTNSHDLVIAPVRGSTMRQKLDNHCSNFSNYETKPTKNIGRRKSMDNYMRKIRDESVRSLSSNIVIVNKCEMTKAQEQIHGKIMKRVHRYRSELVDMMNTISSPDLRVGDVSQLANLDRAIASADTIFYDWFVLAGGRMSENTICSSQELFIGDNRTSGFGNYTYNKFVWLASRNAEGGFSFTHGGTRKTTYCCECTEWKKGFP